MNAPLISIDQIKISASENNIQVIEGYQALAFKMPGKHVWHWFSMSFHKNEFWLSFLESYSQNTGSCKKGLFHGMKVRQSISNKLSIEI